MKIMIPKVIHYCWFGGNPLSKEAEKCIDSWKKYCDDFEIVKWDETNFDINSCTYIKQAYEAGKWAFVSDYARLKIIYDYGGIYFDTDVEVVRKLDDLLNLDCFIGTEEPGVINTGLGFGAVKNNDMVLDMLKKYDNVNFKKEDGSYDITPCPIRNTEAFKSRGYIIDDSIQVINKAKIFPVEYFCPYDYKKAQLRMTKNTYTIHHFSGSWKSRSQKLKDRIKWMIGEEKVKKIKSFIKI